MARITFSESLTYGGRLFGFFLGIFLFGGGLLALGGYLAIPEIQAVVGSGTADTATMAGGLGLAVLGVVALSIGNFALVYKLIADAVSEGTASPTVTPAETGADSESETPESEELGPSPGEQSALEHGPGQTVPSAQTQATQADGPTGDQSPQAQAATDRTVTEQGPGDGNPADAAGTDAGVASSTSGDQTAGAQTSRERTAEEIVFGTGDSSASAEERADSPDPDGDSYGPESAPVEGEDEPEEDPADPTDREDIEKAGDPSSDPLGDGFGDS